MKPISGRKYIESCKFIAKLKFTDDYRIHKYVREFKTLAQFMKSFNEWIEKCHKCDEYYILSIEKETIVKYTVTYLNIEVENGN